MADILTTILEQKTREVAERRARRSIDQMQSDSPWSAPRRGFINTLTTTIQQGHAGVIAEVKKASPSKGIIRQDFQPALIAEQYAAAGAACLSVLTDEQFFQGHDDYLRAAKNACSCPILRKDFVIDAYQIYEARWIGADAILLIVAALSKTQLTELAAVAGDIGLDVLVEVHDAAELDTALALTGDHLLLGINNRNLKTFDTSLQTTLSLKGRINSDRLVVTESGIHTQDEVTLMRDNDVHAFLVGEAFMRADNPGNALQRLFFN